MYYKKKFGYIRVNLNSRLVRTMIKEIDEVKDINSDCPLLFLRKYLKHIWKHPNHNRFEFGFGCSNLPMTSKRLNKRCIYIGANKIKYGGTAPAGSTIISKYEQINIKDIIKYLSTKNFI